MNCHPVQSTFAGVASDFWPRNQVCYAVAGFHAFWWSSWRSLRCRSWSWLWALDRSHLSVWMHFLKLLDNKNIIHTLFKPFNQAATYHSLRSENLCSMSLAAPTPTWPSNLQHQPCMCSRQSWCLCVVFCCVYLQLGRKVPLRQTCQT